MKLLEQVNVRTTFILTGETGAAFRELAKKYATAYPGRFLMFAGFDKTDPDAPDYGERLRRGLREDVEAGAAGLGELTDKGLGLVRVGDTPYFIDDARFDPLWDEAGKLGVPVFVHIAEPAAFYEPPDAKNDLRRSANWSLYGKGTPGFKAMIAKFESVLSRHPKTQFVVGPQLQPHQRPRRASARCSTATPTCRSTSPRGCGSSARQPFTARRFMLARADRILFGTDNDPALADVPRPRAAAGDRGRVVLARRRGVVARLRNGPARRRAEEGLLRERR